VGVGVAAVVLSVALDVPPPHATNNAAAATKQSNVIRIPVPLNIRKFILLSKRQKVDRQRHSRHFRCLLVYDQRCEWQFIQPFCARV
jgi:hypothetical protein